MSEPEAGYHLEFVATAAGLSTALHRLLDRYGVTAGTGPSQIGLCCLY